MEPCLFGLQSETSSCDTYCLILRAHKSGEAVESGHNRPQPPNYVYLWPGTSRLTSKNVVAELTIFIQCCLSDSLRGQILPGVPVWQLGPESRHPGLTYIVFPGNVGGPEALVEVVDALKNRSYSVKN